MNAQMLGLIGKHPGYGDFLRHGIDESLANRLDDWLTSALTPLRDRLGEGWTVFWDQAPVLRFWIGRAVIGNSLAGIMVASRDRVGRRFPLILLVQGSRLPAPLTDPDQTPYEALEAHLFNAGTDRGTGRERASSGGAALLEGLDPVAAGFQPQTDDMIAEGPLIWAHTTEGDLADLLADAVPVDHARAMTARSYWWAPARGGRAAIWLAQNGLPDSDGLGWLLSGGPAATMSAQTPSPVSNTVPRTEAPPDDLDKQDA